MQIIFFVHKGTSFKRHFLISCLIPQGTFPFVILFDVKLLSTPTGDFHTTVITISRAIIVVPLHSDWRGSREILGPGSGCTMAKSEILQT